MISKRKESILNIWGQLYMAKQNNMSISIILSFTKISYSNNFPIICHENSENPLKVIN